MSSIIRILCCLALLVVPSLGSEALKVYFGNLHSHTSYSDGTGKPDEAYRHAKEVAKVDFLALTEHNHKLAESNTPKDRRDGILIAKNQALYNGADADSVISAARKHTKDGEFVALYGQEFSTISSGNHVNVFDVSDVISETAVPNGNFAKLAEWLGAAHDSRNKAVIIQLNHPGLGDAAADAVEYGSDDFPSRAAWVAEIGRHARLIELIVGPATVPKPVNYSPRANEKAYLKYLALGFRIGPAANQDNHYRTWGDATPARTAVVAPALTKDAILDALAARHVYATQDPNLRIIIRVNGALCGDTVAVPQVGAELDIQYSISDDDEEHASYRVQVWAAHALGEEATKVEEVSFSGNGNGRIEDVRYTGAAQYVFFKVIQIDEDGDLDSAWTAPVWFGASADLTPSATDQFVASKNSLIYHHATCRVVKDIKEANRVAGEHAVKGRSLHEGCPK